MAISGRLVLLAALGALVVGLLAPSWTGVVGLAAALAVGVALDLARAGSVRALRVSREEIPNVRLGAEVAAGLLVENPGPRRLTGVLRDAWPPSAGAAPTRHRVDVPAGERRRVTTTLTPTRRGRREAARVTVRAWGPLGLAARQGAHAVPGAVRVLPPFTSRKHLPARLARLRELDGRLPVLVRGPGTEFDSLREYVPGDDVRSLDWRASARSPELVVRTWRPERDRQVVVVLDTGRTSAARVGGGAPPTPNETNGAFAHGGAASVPFARRGRGDTSDARDVGGTRLDVALDAALLLAALASRGGDRVDLLAADVAVRASVLGARDPLPALVAAMATLEPRLVETDARLLVSTVLARAPRRSLVVLFTGLDGPAVREGLEPVLAPLLARHTVLVAAVSDPELATLARGRGDAATVYDAAAATVAQDERRVVAARLARRGVEVVEAGPDELAPAVSDRYLALKAAGRL